MKPFKTERLAIKSVEKILEIEPEVIAPGHGNLLYNPTLELKKAIRKAKKKQCK